MRSPGRPTARSWRRVRGSDDREQERKSLARRMILKKSDQILRSTYATRASSSDLVYWSFAKRESA